MHILILLKSILYAIAHFINPNITSLTKPGLYMQTFFKEDRLMLSKYIQDKRMCHFKCNKKFAKSSVILNVIFLELRMRISLNTFFSIQEKSNL